MSISDGQDRLRTRRWLLKSSAKIVTVAVAVPMAAENYESAEAGNTGMVKALRTGLEIEENSFEMVGGI